MTAASWLAALVDDVVASSAPGTTAPAGVAVCVAEKGALRIDTIGSRDAQGILPVSATTHHDLASVTKVVTTACLMTLVSSGAVALDDEVRRFLPASRAPITVRDLLLHRGGLWEWYPLYAAVDDATDIEAVHALVDSLPARYPPRQAYHYSDLGFIQLGRIVAAAAGSSLPDAVGELIAVPLGLRTLRYGSPADPADVATSALDDRVERTMLDTGEPYPVPFRSTDFAGWRTDPVTGTVNDGNAFHVLGGVSGHAGLFATVDDLATLGVALAVSGEHDDIWAPDVVAQFSADSALGDAGEAGPGPGQALGFRRYAVPGLDATVLGHTGFVGTGIGFVPDRAVAVSMASNRLVTAGTPVATADLWSAVLTRALEGIVDG